MSESENPNYYSSKASLVLVQGELSGFFSIDEDLASADLSYPEHNVDGILDGYFETWAGDDTSISAAEDVFVVLATGRHFDPDPNGNPPGHLQPWGQFFVKDPGNVYVSDTTLDNPVCDNVTFFFNLTVQECYDCYYLSSFISDSSFAFKEGNGNGNPCCTTPGNLTGHGVDKYYLTMSFDNTVNNHYLNDGDYGICDDYNWFYTGWEGWSADDAYYTNIQYGVTPDGLTPDSITPYIDPILSAVGKAYPYEMRFTLNGIMTYSWTLTAVNKGDAYLDFVGTGSYAANGYGFIALDCSLLTGTVTFSEKVVKDTGCCDDLPWWDDWYGPGNRYSYGNGYYDDESPLNPYTGLTWHNMEDKFIWSWPKPYCNNN
jgi:hypothetical protein